MAAQSRHWGEKMKWLVKLMIGAGLGAVLAAGVGAQQQGSEAESLIAAIRVQDGAKVESIVRSQGAGVLNYRGYSGETPLTVAMTARSGTYVYFLLERGAQPNLADKQGDTPLIIASRSGFSEGVNTMLAVRANLEAANRQGETALILAVQRRHAQIVRRLLESGANPDKTDIAAGFSARDYARRDTRNPELLRMIETIKPAKKMISGPVR